MDNADEVTLTFRDTLRTKKSTPIKLIFDWTIPNFSRFKSHTDQILSATRVIGDTSIYLALRPIHKYEDSENGFNIVESDGISLYVFLHQAGTNAYNIHIKGKFGVGNSNGGFTSFCCTPLDKIFDRSIDLKGVGSKSFIKHKDVWGPNPTILVDDALQVRGEVTFSSEVYESHSLSDTSSHTDEDRESFQQSFRDLYESKIGCDFTLVSSDGVEISVHRVVLIARSAVFAAMFESNMVECLNGRSIITDVTGSVLTTLVKFMYGYCSPNDVRNDTLEVMVAADKYQLSGLVRKCEQVLAENLTEQNVVEILALTDGIDAPALRKAASRFILANSGALKHSPDINAVDSELCVLEW